jgi:hypothetical protein
MSDPAVIGEAQGWFNVVGGAWPLQSLRTFEAIFGPRPTGGSSTQSSDSSSPTAPARSSLPAARCGETDTARRLGGGTALTLLAIDVVFVPAGRIRWTYLIDAALEAGWLGLWAGTRRR